MTDRFMRPFDLDKAVATWRSFVSSQSSLLPEDIEELENHLRDEYDAARADGLMPVDAFDRAKKRTGDPGGLQHSYRAVEFEKRTSRKRLGPELRTRFGLTANYFKGVLRNASRYRGFAAVNLIGLSLGLAVAMIIGLYIRHSLSYDRFHADADRIFRLTQTRGQADVHSRVSYGLAWLIRDGRTDVELVTQVQGTHGYEVPVTVDGRHMMVDGILFTDAGFLEVFDHDLLAAAGQNPLAEPRSVVLTESTARQLFDVADPIGRTLRLDSSADFTVTGVVADPPSNTHLPFNMLVGRLNEPVDMRWNFLGPRVYVRMAPDASPEGLAAHLTDEFSKGSPGAISSFAAERVTDIQLRSAAVDQYAAVGDARYLLIFGGIGVLILLMAGINYMNMATAQAAGRSREVGVRKAVGASSGQIRGQFLLESVTMTVLSVPIAVLIVVAVTPWVNGITGEQLAASMLLTVVPVAGLAVLVGLIGLCSGAYPSILMARSKPARIFSGGGLTPSGRLIARRLLVGVQIAVSFGMIVMTVLISNQLSFIRTQNLGFEEEQVVVLSPRGWTPDQIEWFNATVTSTPGVESAALGLPLGVDWRYIGWSQPVADSTESVRFDGISAGPGFFETMGIPIVRGRGFIPEDADREAPAVVVSKSYADLFGGVESVVGSRLESGEWGEIVGVVGDIRNKSAHVSENVTVYMFSREYEGAIVARLAAGRISDGLAAMRRAWSELSPDRPFDYEFLDDRIQQQYTAEMKLARIFRGFSVISIVIAALGLMGLAALAARRRLKEIGIRKTLGASAGSILLLLSREFAWTVVISVGIISPFVYQFGQRWLQGFADRVEFTWPLFAVAGFATLTFVLFSVGVQSMRAAAMNPVDSLRTD